MIHLDGDLRAEESRTLVFDHVRVWLAFSSSFHTWLLVTPLTRRRLNKERRNRMLLFRCQDGLKMVIDHGYTTIILMVGHYIRPSCWFGNGGEMVVCIINKMDTDVVHHWHNTTIFIFVLWSIITMLHLDGDVRAEESSTLVFDRVRVWLAFSSSFHTWLLVTPLTRRRLNKESRNQTLLFCYQDGLKMVVDHDYTTTILMEGHYTRPSCWFGNGG